MNNDSSSAHWPDRLSTREEFLRTTGDTPERLTELCWNKGTILQTLTEEGECVEQDDLQLAFLLEFTSSPDNRLD